MVRPLTILSLIFTFVIALQNHSEYWVITSDVCPPEMQQCKAEAPVCRSSARAGCESGQPETHCESTCSSASQDCASANSEPICLQTQCTASPQKPRCCLLVYPFWGELPVKLLLTPDNLSIPAPEYQLIETADANSYIADKYIIPPWGVHPTIATTVLRI